MKLLTLFIVLFSFCLFPLLVLFFLFSLLVFLFRSFHRLHIFLWTFYLYRFTLISSSEAYIRVTTQYYCLRLCLDSILLIYMKSADKSGKTKFRGSSGQECDEEKNLDYNAIGLRTPTSSYSNLCGPFLSPLSIFGARRLIWIKVSWNAIRQR